MILTEAIERQPASRQTSSAKHASSQTMSTERSLHSLLDIEGVYGSFILAASGALTARDLPAVFDDHTLAEAGERIVRLWSVLSDNGAPEYTVIDFAEYSLFVRGLSARGDLTAGCLCVVIPPSVNLLALQLASKWVVRSIAQGSGALAASG